jgi:putative ABC transport system substrate-binding protein
MRIVRHVGVFGLRALLLALGVIASPLAEAQPAGTVPRLCFLTFDSGTLQSNRFGPFFQGLRDRRL